MDERNKRSKRFVNGPHSSALDEIVMWNGRRLLLRPIRPEDEAQHLRFLDKIDADDLRMRLFYSKREISHAELARLTQINCESEMAFIATTVAVGDGKPETLGVVRAIADPDNLSTEMAIIVRSDLKGSGLGRLLLEKMIRYCRERGLSEMTASVLQANQRMLALAKRIGFTAVASAGGVVELRLGLQGDSASTRPDKSMKSNTY